MHTAISRRLTRTITTLAHKVTQDMEHHYSKHVPNTARSPLRCSVVILLCLFFTHTKSLLACGSAQAQGSSPVMQEIRYYMPEAGEVFLVWGIDG
jgi:hypothetical protein